MNVAKRVRADLKRKHKSQNQLARDLGISQAHMSAILSGKRKPSITLASRLEDVTGIPAREFAEVA